MDCLPNDLLVQILSFLPTKQAVSTSLLSKRWRTLFSLLHNLDFDEPISGRPEDIRKSFNDFVDSSLAYLGVNHIKKFSLKHTEKYLVGPDIERWICNALEHGVSELHLHIKSALWYRFQSQVLTSTTLVKLSLGTEQYIDRFSPDTSLPALKVLLLDSIWYWNDQQLNVLLAACPALEDLTIRYKHIKGRSYLISSKSMKKLSVTIKSSYCKDRSSIITLDTPSVVDLYYSGFPHRKVPHCNLASLAKATLHLHFLENENLISEKSHDADVENLISEIRNVKTLHLTSSAVEVISVCCKGGLPVFNNLVELMFSSKKQGWKVLSLLLERSPNLKTLVLSGMDRFTRIPPNNQIKMLSIKQYQGSATELKQISHLLLNMECLELVKVYVAAEIDDLKKMELTEDVLKLPAASSKLKIQVLM
ncbi:F-box-like domain superfamily [Arabidopsis thaliana x Arabidopsis arenosa]|uniref:F-box-like domain superfamily n=1 Tax=Arabidopsis thaliana x Arabidopsis arenosa TaxID=1240361 RepID=A0A8T1ZMY6_9BRAS|nr:F-box-like domain superfamily [Arabidopsis thaliana x Arabidopsis arenosa]